MSRVRITLELLDLDPPIKTVIEGKVDGPLTWGHERVEGAEDGWRVPIDTGRFKINMLLGQVDLMYNGKGQGKYDIHS